MMKITSFLRKLNWVISINQSFSCSQHIKQWSSFSLNIRRDEQDSQAPGALMAALNFIWMLEIYAYNLPDLHESDRARLGHIIRIKLSEAVFFGLHTQGLCGTESPSKMLWRNPGRESGGRAPRRCHADRLFYNKNRSWDVKVQVNDNFVYNLPEHM